ncbi:bifunctional phosphoribosyl-AMP cyclohydrolase/phosphoribosyl-ATP diphosphatase HisIE [Campylobacter showae]|uniref:Histidine biosynthesis bifunctional protein HisIE n=1 Tax=Campylobacter showae CC57C TaxID=1073353 RepID=M3JDK7_9BACT|nr:bifunctional phosphoribosyl-AMP cyclohydrolase/phosphoribosyl-ATP diphosphatase HisIE [Campylobacter showae]EMG30777.1 histidine biosynthesis bifunctional protein hisIE [Campylobacter showae CC57C]
MKIDWEKVGGLLPAVVQESSSGEVLMLAYMNEEALNLSLKTGFAHYFSRTKNRIWKKGEESGNTQAIDDIFLDCDNDTILLKVVQNGGIACHTGAKSCFFRKISGDGGESNLASDDGQNLTREQNLNQAKKPIYGIIDEVYHAILDRKLNADSQTSYVASLFKKGENAILKKVGEEATELVMACKDASVRKNETSQFDSGANGGQISSNLTQNENFAKISNKNSQTETSQNQKPKTPTEEIIYEAADLCFHSLVALALHGIHPDRVKAELARRFGMSGIEEKNSRKG